MLVGKKVILRTVRESDLDTLFELTADVRDAGDHWPLQLRSEHATRKRFQENGWWDDEFGALLITDREDRILGQIVLFKAAVYQNAYEFGYRIFKPDDRGKGYVSEAVSLAVAFLFETKTIDRIQATTLPESKGSRRVLEKCSFAFEGIMRKAMFHRGRSQDLCLYSILRDDTRRLSELLT
jgi:ribosomal-protein-alanine N-acetyltransferase